MLAQRTAKRYFGAVIAPLGDRVLCREVETEETYGGGPIIAHPNSREVMTSEQAEVVAVGPEVEGLSPGDWVIHRPHVRQAGPEDKTFWLRFEDVLLKLEVV